VLSATEVPGARSERTRQGELRRRPGAPKGQGFALDPRSRSDCRYRLEATGEVVTARGCVYLRATSLRLLGRAKDE
jgi:hypothetical protein